MFLRATVRKKDGKEHTYFSVVENKRVADGRVVQRHVLYLGEINSSQELAWRKSGREDSFAKLTRTAITGRALRLQNSPESGQ